MRRAVLLVGRAEDANDLVHDAFIEVYRRWGELRDPGPYLAQAVLNRCRDHGRRASTRARRLPLLVERGGPEDEVLWDALQRLPFNQRAVIVLRFYHQMTEPEIAAVMECRPGSVGPWIRRGLRELRKELSCCGWVEHGRGRPLVLRAPEQPLGATWAPARRLAVGLD